MGSSCTWVAGGLVSSLQGLILWSSRKNFFLVGFCLLTTHGSLGDGMEVEVREETNAVRVAFDICLKGLSFVVKRHGYYLMLYSLLLPWMLITYWKVYSLFSPICKRRTKNWIDHRVSHKVTWQIVIGRAEPSYDFQSIQ